MWATVQLNGSRSAKFPICLFHTHSSGKFFNLADPHARTKVRCVLLRELLYADDAASLLTLQLNFNFSALHLQWHAQSLVWYEDQP